MDLALTSILRDLRDDRLPCRAIQPRSRERAKSQAKRIELHTRVYGFNFELNSLVAPGIQSDLKHNTEEARKFIKVINDVTVAQKGFKQCTIKGDSRRFSKSRCLNRPDFDKRLPPLPRPATRPSIGGPRKSLEDTNDKERKTLQYRPSNESLSAGCLLGGSHGDKKLALLDLSPAHNPAKAREKKISARRSFRNPASTSVKFTPLKHHSSPLARQCPLPIFDDTKKRLDIRSSDPHGILPSAYRSNDDSSATSFRHYSKYHDPSNEFPNFAQTGDVEIIINAEGQEKRYMLHRLILAQCSGFFEAGTSEDWSRTQAQGVAPPAGPAQSNGLAKIGEEDEHGKEAGRPGLPYAHSHDRYRWRYELDWGNKDDEVPMLVQKPPSSTLFGGDQTYRPPAVPNKPPPPPSNGFFRSFAAMQSAAHVPHQAPDNDLIRDYDNLFRIFYNYPPNLDPLNIAESYIQCKSLLNLADMYDALEVVGPRIDHHLLQFQSRLWKQIAKYPPSYLKLGYLARSKVIFAEALVHVVGQWPSGSNQLRHHVPESVFDLIEDKVEELAEKKIQTEGKLFRLTLTTPRGERVSPANNYMDWLALSLFRQWLVENTSPPPPLPPKNPNNSNQPSPRANNTTTNNSSNRTQQTQHQNPPISSGHLYRLLFTAGSAYLPHDELKRFFKTAKAFASDSLSGGSSSDSNYRREELKKFERRMDEVKLMAKETVRPLMRSFLELDLGRD
ncbi:MAG: hypothetical protein Q9225_005525, partial [Loekoesia sp. 1 TL-2023]